MQDLRALHHIKLEGINIVLTLQLVSALLFVVKPVGVSAEISEVNGLAVTLGLTNVLLVSAELTQLRVLCLYFLN